MIQDIKFASYLEEAGEEPKIAADTLVEHNINYVALRHVWTNNIGSLNDDGCNKLRGLLRERDLSVIALMTTIGAIPASTLTYISDAELQRPFDLSTYFGAKYIRFGVGLKEREFDIWRIHTWMSRITEFSIRYNVVPLMEIVDNGAISEPADVASLLLKFKKWRLIYDPVQLILRRNINPHIKYWVLLKDSVEFIDVRDYKINKGFKPVGFGDSKIVDTVNDAISSNYKGWFVAEPTLGRKYGNVTSRSGTFGLAMEAINSLFV